MNDWMTLKSLRSSLAYPQCCRVAIQPTLELRDGDQDEPSLSADAKIAEYVILEEVDADTEGLCCFALGEREPWDTLVYTAHAATFCCALSHSAFEALLWPFHHSMTISKQSRSASHHGRWVEQTLQLTVVVDSTE